MTVKKIGFFDSGIGGLSTLKALFDIMPNCEAYYIADLLYAPYGPLSDEVILERSKYLTEILIDKGVDLVVIACNTATATSIDFLRKNYDIPFVGVEPYLNIIHHQKLSKDDKIAVLTTRTMGRSDRFQKLKERLDPEKKIKYFECQNLATLVERAFWNKMDQDLLELIKDELKLVARERFTHIILGCTHYTLIGDHISSALNAKVISPCDSVAKRIKSLISVDYNNSLSEGKGKSFYYLDTRNLDFWDQKLVKELSLLWPSSQ